LAGIKGVQSIEPSSEEALLPTDDGWSAGLEPPLDGVEGLAHGQHQD